MPPGDTFEGITVPKGSPDDLRTAGRGLSGLAGEAGTAATAMTALPTTIGAWTGAASTAFAGATVPAAAALTEAVTAFDLYAAAIADGAGRLERAQKEAEEAIEQARDARRRIKAAQAAIGEAEDRASSARAQSTALTVALAATGPAGSIAGLESQRAAADADAAQAEGDGARARRALEEAQDDLEQAKRRGHEAMREADEAKQAIASALQALSPTNGSIVLTGGPARGGGPGGGRPIFGPDGSIRRLDLTVDEFDRMSLADRQHWMRQFQEQYGERGNFNTWFRNIEGILQFAGERDTIQPGTAQRPGSWFSLVDAAILHGIQNGYAQSQGRRGGGHNPGAAAWRSFFDYRRRNAGDSSDAIDEESKKRWARGEQASTDFGADVVAPAAGRTPSFEERMFLLAGDGYRKVIVPYFPQEAPGYGLADPRNQEVTRDAAEGIYDISHEAVEGYQETTDEGLEAAREISEAPPHLRTVETVEGLAETGGQAVEGLVETGAQYVDAKLDTADDLLDEGGRVLDEILPGD